MQRKEYKLPNGKTAVFEYDVCGIGKITLECMDELMSMIADRPQGEWKPFDLTWGRSIYACSVCEEAIAVPCGWSDGKPIYDYCPNCGADMREREGE